MMFKVLSAFLLPAMLSIAGCHNESGIQNRKPDRAQIETLNRYMVQKDKERIQSYIERKGLKMTETPTGLWYGITREGDGAPVTVNSSFMIEYECSLLDGTVCYTSEDTGPKQIILGRTPIEPGLNEGLRLLRYGSQAIFILPPQMGFGLPGDGKKIPPRSILVYKVNILHP
jgi:FKBP-type peptidyl-prolyl cis-trans isomerase